MLVFSKEKFLESRKNDDRLLSGINDVIIGWPDKCEGLTPYDCKTKGYGVVDEWCVDIPVDYMTILQNEIKYCIDHECTYEQIIAMQNDKTIRYFVSTVARLANISLSENILTTLVAWTKQKYKEATVICR